jgi:hypothetical protein
VADSSAIIYLDNDDMVKEDPLDSPLGWTNKEDGGDGADNRDIDYNVFRPVLVDYGLNLSLIIFCSKF